MGPGDVSVVIPALADEPYLDSAIDTALAEGAGEVLVVGDDGGSTADVCRRRGVRRIEPCGLHPPIRRNQGAREARLPALAFLDADDLYPPGRMAAMTALLGDGVSGLARSFASPDVADEVMATLRVDPTPRFAEVMGALLFRRESFFALGGCREDIVSGDGVEWLYRAREAGMEVVELEEVVVERRIHKGVHHSREHAEELHASLLQLARERILRSRGA